MNCVLCKNKDEVKFITTLNDNVVCLQCGCINKKKIFDNFIENNVDYVYKKRVFYKRINYVSEILNRINSFMYNMNNKIINKVKKELVKYEYEINYYNIRKILKNFKLGCHYRHIP